MLKGIYMRFIVLLLCFGRIVYSNGCVYANTVNVSSGVAPVADAGVDQTIGLPRTSYVLYGNGYDADGDAIVSYAWTKLSGPTVTLSGNATNILTLTNIVAGSYVFRLTVTDGTGATAYDDVTVTASVISNNYTYIKNESILKSGVVDVAQVGGLPVSDKATIIQYLDGSGKVKQSVGVKASPLQYDIVTPSVYDELGQQSLSYLPYASLATDGFMKPGILVGTGGTYTGSDHQKLYTGSLSGVVSDGSPYTLSIQEKSPLGRVTESGNYGAVYQPNLSTPAQGKTSKVSYTRNAYNEVLQFGISGTGMESVLSLSQYYFAANSLNVVVSADAEGNQVKEYTNSKGEVLLKKVQLNTSEWLETYYVYDNVGNLIFIISPELSKFIRSNYSVTFISTDGTLLVQNTTLNASSSSTVKWDYWPDVTVTLSPGYTASPGFHVKPWGNNTGSYTTVSADKVKALAYQYAYDAKGRQIASRAPGVEWKHNIYNSKGDLVLTQPAHLRASNQWYFYKYDRYGRTILYGLLTTTDSPETLRVNAEANTAFFETYTSSGSIHGYTNNAFPVVDAASCLIVSYYDDYQFSSLIGNTSYNYNPAELSGLPSTATTSVVRGLPTGEKLRSLTGNTWIWKVLYYDEDQRVVQAVAGNFKGGIDRVSEVYSFSGLLLSNKVNHSTSAGSISLKKRFEYNHAGLLLKTYHQINTQPEILYQKYTYNELGQVIDKSIHSTDDGATWLQSLDYTYTIQGQLSKLNNLTGNAGETDFIGFEYAYENVVSGAGNTGRYDGIPSAQRWSNDLSSKTHLYNFTYDKAGQFAAGQYKRNIGGTWSSVDKFTENNVSYDFNGNIKTLTRYQNGSNAIDQLTYSYGTGGNQLLKVDDGGTTAGFKNGSNTGDDYTYDIAGNVVSDKNKNIQSIEYNALNLPARVLFSDNSSVEYYYDASGNKLSQKIFNNAGQLISTTDYVGSFIYLDGSLQYILTGEGRILPAAYTNLIANREAGSLDGFTAKDNVTLSVVQLTNQTYVKAVCNQATGTPGIWPVGGTYTVKAGESYSFKVLGYQSSGTTAKLYIWGNTGNLLWPGVVLPQGSGAETWVTSTFTIPTGVTQIKVGVLWETPASGNTFFINRVALYKTDLEYQYFLRDQVGSPRVVLSTSPSTLTYTATFETENQTDETTRFQNINYTKVSSVPAAANATAGGNESIWMDNTYRIGPARSMKVYPGDKVDASVYAYYDAVTGMTKAPASVMAAALVSVMSGGVSAIDGGINAAYSSSSSGVPGFLLSPDQGATKPSAFLNYILFDENYVALEAKSVPIGSTAGARQQISLSGSSSVVQAKEVGYLFVYLSYDNESTNRVYFDELSIIHTESAVVQVNDYYPFGLTAYSWTREGESENRFLYQGKEADTKTGWQDFHARQYDPTLGRWFATDPAGQFASPYNAMGNNPAAFIDPDGRWVGWDDAVVAAVGFAYGYVSYGIQHDDWGKKALVNGGINAALFELGYLTAGGGLALTAGGSASGTVAMNTAGSYLASQAVSVAASQVLPSIPIYQSDNFSLGISPTFSLSGVGVSLNGSYSYGDFTVSGGVGLTGVYKGGIESRMGGSLSYFDGHYGASYSVYAYGGHERQRLGEFGFRFGHNGDFGFRMSNDLFPLADGGDKYRTAAGQLSYKEYSLGVLLHTGDPDGPDGTRSIDHTAGGKGGQYNGGTSNDPKLRAGNAYFGYNNYRFGWNGDGIRHVFQNKLIHDGFLDVVGEPSPWFSRIPIGSHPYFDANTNNPFSLWGY